MADIERADTSRSANVGLSVGAGLKRTARRVIQNIDYLQSASFLAGAQGPHMDLGDYLYTSFNANGDFYFVADKDITFVEIDESPAEDGSLTYNIAELENPTDFNQIDFPNDPIVLHAGDVLKITLTDIVVYKTISLRKYSG